MDPHHWNQFLGDAPNDIEAEVQRLRLTVPLKSRCRGEHAHAPGGPAPVGISVLMDHGLEVHGNEFLAMFSAFHNVIRRFLAAHRVDELLNRGADELRR
jgi:hypothetical protein